MISHLNIKTLPFPESQYYKSSFEKKQIVLHHTASGRGTDGDYRHWLNTPERIATCLVVDQDGSVNQMFSSKFWGHHIGLRAANNTALNKASIAIEIDSWGGLVKKNGKWYSYTGTEVSQENVIEYPAGYRGYFAFERYTDSQIESVRCLLLHWNKLYKIPLSYNEGMWDVSPCALKGEPGVFTHTSFRRDKSDCHPQTELIEMLKYLDK